MAVLKVYDGTQWVTIPILTDHGGLDGLTDNDHTQYILHSSAIDFELSAATDVSGNTGATTFTPGVVLALSSNNVWVPSSIAAGTDIDHGGLSGLADDDHPQYILHSSAIDFILSAATDVSGTVGAPPFENGDVLALSSNHTWVPSGLSNYEAKNRKGVTGGYCGLDGGGLVDTENLGDTGVGHSTSAAPSALVISQAQTWVLPPAASSDSLLNDPGEGQCIYYPPASGLIFFWPDADCWVSQDTYEFWGGKANAQSGDSFLKGPGPTFEASVGYWIPYDMIFTEATIVCEGTASGSLQLKRDGVEGAATLPNGVFPVAGEFVAHSYFKPNTFLANGILSMFWDAEANNNINIILRGKRRFP